jgi:hypothetical protein
MVGNAYSILATATHDGYVEIPVFDDPVITIANPIVTPPTPPAPAPSIDNSAMIKAAEAKAAADQQAERDKATAELKISQEKAAAELKAAREKAEAEIKAAEDAATRLKAEEDAKKAAELKAKEDAEIAAKLASQKIAPDITLYSISSTLKLSIYDSAYLKKYVATLKPKATITCIGYIYPKNTSLAKAKLKAMSQASAICKLIKAQRKTLTTNVVIYPASKAPTAATGAKWVAVSYRVDGFKS